MNRLSYLVVLSAALTLAVACGDDEGGNGETVDAAPQPDADTTVDPGPCGLNIGSSSAPNLDPSSWYLEPLNLAGVPVFFHAPDGQLIGFELTDVKGEASIDECVENTSITFILNADQADNHVVTYTHVQPESTAYYRVYPEEGDPPLSYANVSVTGDPDVSMFPEGGDSTNSWRASFGCWDQPPSVYQYGVWRFHADVDNDYTGPEKPLPFTTTQYPVSHGLPYCALGENTSDVDVLAYLSAGEYGDVGYAFLKDVPISLGTDDENVTENAITLPPWTRGSLENATLLTNLPWNTSYARYWSGQLVDSVLFAGDNDSEGWNIDEGAVVPPVLAFSYRGLPDGFGERSYGHGDWWLPTVGPSLWTHNQGVDVYGPFDRTTTIDAADRLPVIDSLEVADVYTAQPKFRWKSDAPIHGTVGAFLFQLFVGEDPECSIGCLKVVSWLVITPETDSGELTVPRLSDEFISLIEDKVINTVPVAANIWDASHIEYSDVIGNPPFNPWDLLWEHEDGLGDVIPLPDTSADARVRHTRTWHWQYDREDQD